MSVSQPIPFPSSYYALLREPGAILLHTSRLDEPNARSFLFLRPIRQLTVRDGQDFSGLFPAIQDVLRSGHYIAGFMSYEAGSYFEKSGKAEMGLVPLACFNVYSQAYIFHHQTGKFEGDAPPEPIELETDEFSVENLE